MQQVDTPPPASPLSPTSTSKSPSPIATGFLFAFVTALLAFQPLTRLAYLKLFAGSSGEPIQEPIPPGFPVPRALAWSPFTRSLISSTGTLTSAAVLTIGIVLCSIFAYALLRILNPTFRITTGVDWHESVLFKTYMHTSPLIKAFLIGMCAALPLFLFWQVVRLFLGETALGLWIQLTVTGVVCLALFSRSGVAGDYESLSYDLPRDGKTWANLTVRGTLAGSLIWIAWRFEPTYGPDTLFAFFRSMGGIGEVHFWKIVAIRCGMAGLLAFGLGGLMNVVGAPNRSRTRELQLGVVPAIIFGLMLYIGRVGLPDYLRSHHDFDPGTKMPEQARLATAAGLHAPRGDGEQVLLLDPRGATPIHFELKSVVGAPADERSTERIKHFLQQRGYATALSYATFVTLYDATSLAFDPEASLRALVTNVLHCPERGSLRLLADKLVNMAATPAVIQSIAHVISDETLLFPDRQSCVYAGDVWASLGERERARSWYRRAYMPATQIDEHYAESTRFINGSASGKIEIDGKPLAGIRIGVMPVRSLRLLTRFTDPTGRVSPFWLWQVTAAATTNSQGEFRLDRLIAGRYMVLARLPEEMRVHAGPTGLIEISDTSPNASVGTVSLRTNDRMLAPRKAQAGRAPSGAR